MERTGSEGVARPEQGRLAAWLRRPCDGAALAAFRILYGVILSVEALRYLISGDVRTTYLDPPFLFTYPFFDWVRPVPFLEAIFAVMAVTGALIALGVLQRISALVYAVAFTYVFLLEQAKYLNHYYFVSLLTFLFAFLPADRCWSLRAWLERDRGRDPFVPFWAYLVPGAQVAVVYVYGGIAKLNADWLAGEPLRQWLPARADRPVFGPLLEEEWVIYLFSWGGALFDLFIVPLLLWRRTRWFALALVVFFHLTNASVFGIGIFPWLTLASTSLFFPPSWPRRLIAWLYAKAPALPRPPEAGAPMREGSRALMAFFAVWFAIQMLVPFRHWLYPGNVSWTEEGHNFAWHMKLRDKHGKVVFHVNDPASGRSWIVQPWEELSPRQVRKMTTRPDMILLYAHRLRDRWIEMGHPDVQVRASTSVSLNGRPSQELVDPGRDLAKVSHSLRAYDWVMPLRYELDGTPIRR